MIYYFIYIPRYSPARLAIMIVNQNYLPWKTWQKNVFTALHCWFIMRWFIIILGETKIQFITYHRHFNAAENWLPSKSSSFFSLYISVFFGTVDSNTWLTWNLIINISSLIFIIKINKTQNKRLLLKTLKKILLLSN